MDIVLLLQRCILKAAKLGHRSLSGVEKLEFTARRSLPLLQAWSLGYKYSWQLALRIFQNICGKQETKSSSPAKCRSSNLILLLFSAANAVLLLQEGVLVCHDSDRCRLLNLFHALLSRNLLGASLLFPISPILPPPIISSVMVVSAVALTAAVIMTVAVPTIVLSVVATITIPAVPVVATVVSSVSVIATVPVGAPIVTSVPIIASIIPPVPVISSSVIPSISVIPAIISPVPVVTTVISPVTIRSARWSIGP